MNISIADEPHMYVDAVGRHKKERKKRKKNIEKGFFVCVFHFCFIFFTEMVVS